ncbi:hypothetical protein [Methylocystis sp. JR02]|uniref:hypothetical protein n=1 Tax=Methylocystis sp. JR02 TaxID=3046284 RepID=UPI0024B8EAE2|nr:hypothetical protein [Methylocystis sp. JR02]MDJ0450296.1 hypothetical protein [Methylocystis sp. JR02]
MTNIDASIAALACRGAANPEKVENLVWLEAMRNGWSAYRLGETIGRTYPSPPLWSWERFGRSRTPLADGRTIHVAGEHEDFYDPDFYIYNDVVVEYSDGYAEFYLYPPEIFPPTDFHSATLMGDWLWLIGGLGYQGARGKTVQVMRLDTRDFHIESMETTGDVPGWLSRHCAEPLDDARILVVGGQFVDENSSEPNRELFELDLTTLRWRRRAHSDMALFPISREDYDACKNPRAGRANPEKSDNPFWLEMARRRWLPSRARLHYGDPGPEKPKFEFPKSECSTAEEIAEAAATFETGELNERQHDIKKMLAAWEASRPSPLRPGVVWTARRDEAALVTLPDGARVQIGGSVLEFCDGFENEWPDVWTYSDVIVEKPDGGIDIFIYPPDLLPPLSPLCAVARRGCLLVFGRIDRSAGREHSWQVVLRLDTQTFEITVIDEGGAPPRTIFSPEFFRVKGDLALFELCRDTGDQPRRCAVFDLAELCWRDEIAPYDEEMEPEAGN